MYLLVKDVLSATFKLSNLISHICYFIQTRVLPVQLIYGKSDAIGLNV